MSQLILTGVGDYAQNVRLEQQPDLTVGPDDVLLQMEAAPINPVDGLFSNGWYAVQPQLPSFIGSEGVGRVRETGTATDPALAGRRVVILGSYEQGAWADQVVVPARNVVAVPEGIDAAQLSMLTINPITAHLMLTRYVDLKPGDWIAQTLGNSAVARSVITLARIAGIRTISVVRSEKAAEEARAAGGEVVLVDGDDLAERTAQALAGQRLRLVLDGAGGSTAGALATGLETGGTIVSYSSATGEPPAIPLGNLVYGELSLRGLWVVNWFHTAPRAEIEKVIGELVDLVARGELVVPVDSTYPLHRYAEAFARNASPERTGKVLFRFDAAA
ncbi:zinc-dependent alcohol dehydrogenase family protein [Micromonospora sp. NPDC007208]|uniref:zinc-dependent alcohol dehydrogenase family protein n=1 Tax=Micromonospora sp. NPDC007208 TaxID=3364236 RepID=UPI00368707C6